MSDVSAQPRWLLMPENSGVRALKFWVHSSLPSAQQVKWELRRILDELRDTAADTNKVLRDERSQWQVVFSAAGASNEDMVLPSAYAYRYKHKKEPPTHLVDAAQVETTGVICVMLWYLLLRRAQGRDRARLVLRSFLQTVLQSEDVVADLGLLRHSNAALEASAECQRQQGLQVSGEICQHVRQMLVQALQQTDSADVVADLLQSMFSQRETCCAARPSFQALLGSLTEHVAQNALFLGTSNPLDGDTDMRGKGKRRLDADRKGALIGSALTDRKAKSIKTLSLARGEQGADNADRWLHEEAAAYRWAVAASFQGVQNLALCYDASKLGQPKEETLVVAAADVDRGRAAWFMPQARESWAHEPDFFCSAKVCVHGIFLRHNSIMAFRSAMDTHRITSR